MSCTDIVPERIPLLKQKGCPAGEVARGMPAALENKGRDSIRVLFASPEVFPLAKTGGLADVSAALPAALAELGVDVHLVMPGYTEALDFADSKQKSVPLGDVLGLGEAAVIAARTPDTGIPLWLVDCPALFRRPGMLYGDTEGRDWPDNALRFALFSHVVARLALGKTGANWHPHVVHVNDWHLGLIPALLAAQPAPRPPTIFTMHNLAFQGVFPTEVFPRPGLPSEWLSAEGVEFYGQVSFLKAGIRFADRLEFCTEEHDEFMQTVLGFEHMLVKSGIKLLKYYLDISQNEQRKRPKDRRKDPLKQWKISPIDAQVSKRWADYSLARNEMFARTHNPVTPWTVVRADDKRLAHLNLIKDLLSRLRYDDKDDAVLRTNPGNHIPVSGVIRSERHDRFVSPQQRHAA